jgi:hypothetical protein
MTLNGTVGITDRFDVSAAIPFVRVMMQGERIDTYRGRQLLQATGSASASLTWQLETRRAGREDASHL